MVPTGMLEGKKEVSINGQSVSFEGLTYKKAPEKIALSVQVNGIDYVDSCTTEVVSIIPDEPVKLKIKEVREASDPGPRFPPLAPIAGDEETERGSPLWAGENFCVIVCVQDQFGNTVDETDEAIRKLYEGRPSEASQGPGFEQDMELFGNIGMASDPPMPRLGGMPDLNEFPIMPTENVLIMPDYNRPRR
eukprot:Sspe_Gene.5261::Locus_1731_Transcript_1_1_Confidence_1.000_Length_2059::g.5261::m.5261